MILNQFWVKITLKTMKKKLLFIALTTLSLATHAQNVNIPDANFKAYLVGNSSINTNGDAEIQLSEAAGFNGTINCSSMSQGNIANLTGIEAFTSLTGLNCANNQITSLDVSNNLTLQVLICDRNNLINLDVSVNSVLISLDCSLNELVSLNVANGNNPNFTSLKTAFNPLLTCIEVDNENFSYTEWSGPSSQFIIDGTSSFSENCGSSLNIENINSENTIFIFPNPAQDVITIFELPLGAELSILDITGKIIFSTTVNSNQLIVNTDEFSNGIYLVNVNTNGSTTTKKLVVNK
jgi:hypothetical protein